MNGDDDTNPYRDAEREQALAELAEMERGVCILTAENMATEDDCTTHDHKIAHTGNAWDFAPSYD